VKRNPNLDMLRGVAVLMVLAHHFDLFDAGWAGVDLFFVLSGFLISGLLFAEWQKTGNLNIRRFYIRRALKIYPAFYLFFGVTALITASAGVLRIGSFWAVALFVQNYVSTAALPAIWGHTWSLAVEEHFYLLLPPLLWLLARSGFRLLPVCFALVAGAVLAMRFRAGWHLSGGELDIWYAPTHLRIDSLFFGVLLQWMRTFHPALFLSIARNRYSVVPVAGAIAMLAVFPLESQVMHTIGFTVLYLGFGALLVMMVDRPPMRILNPLARMGGYSYSIYLWHRLFAILIPHSGLPAFALYLALSIAWGILMAKLVELPALAVRDRLFPAKAPLALCAA
jgi:peptidoglycan/LPS O-acetylase OafA/YrhL